MDAVLTPNRSLTQRGFARLLAGFALLNMTISTVFIAQGAFPVAVFLALDVALLWTAFRMNYKAGQEEERVRVGSAFVHVFRRDPKGRAVHWVVSPLWAQVATSATAVRISSAGKTMLVGAFLSPEEREAFSKALGKALAEAKAPKRQ